METVKDATKKLRRIFSGDEGGNVEELKKILSEFPALMNQVSFFSVYSSFLDSRFVKI